MQQKPHSVQNIKKMYNSIIRKQQKTILRPLKQQRLHFAHETTDTKLYPENNQKQHFAGMDLFMPARSVA